MSDTATDTWLSFMHDLYEDAAKNENISTCLHIESALLMHGYEDSAQFLREKYFGGAELHNM